MRIRALIVLGAATLCACHGPSGMCEDTRLAYNAAYERCGFGVMLPEKWLTFASGPCAGIPQGCDRVNDIRDAEAVVDVCIPAIEQATCEELMADPMLSSSCDATNFIARVVEGEMCF
jgi:hypothetical protein